MPYVTVPKDLTKVKTKVLFNLTKRQLICFGSGLLIGVPLFFLTKEPLGNNLADDLHDAACLSSRLVRKERSAFGGHSSEHDPLCLFASEAAPLQDQQFLCRDPAAKPVR